MNNKNKMISNIFKTAGILLIALILFDAGSFLGYFAVFPLVFSSNKVLEFLGTYAGFIGIWVAVFGLCLKSKKQKFILSKLGKKKKGNNVKTALLIGLPLGIGLNLLVGMTALLHGDISLSFAGINPVMLILFLAVIAIQSGAEELINRCFIYENIRKIFPDAPVVAIALNALFFAALHLGNNGISVLAIINIMLVGFLYSMVVYYFKSFWAVTVAHTTWNFCQNILLGLPNSGIVSCYSVFKLDAANTYDSFTYNTAFGIEGTVMSCVVLAVACIVVFYLGQKKTQKISAHRGEMINARLATA